MINLEIDGKVVQVENGATVMDAAHKVGASIPHFCYHKKLSIAANCRMCLVQVEKAPKPLPACATPATEGMKVNTKSDYAVNAQKGVMEFLLINHPLDCPICDQGGECQLQDLAVGYGGSASRYAEEKRVVVNKNLGPLISTDMTRCIHCTRCVRFGQEVAGVMELGMAGRGEHSEILSFVGRSVDSELSGNMIDLCPVGALTSKPFRYSARTWELSRRKSVAAHDSLGSNIAVQVKNDRVMRVLPLENESINECWISDRDRFSYEGLNSEERLTQPMIKQNGSWQVTDWPTALSYASHALKSIAAEEGADAIAGVIHPSQTLEEAFLFQGLLRALGTDHIDYRLHQRDFSHEAARRGAPWLGLPIADLSVLDRVLLVGSTLRKEQPLIASRLRVAAKKKLKINVVHAAGDDLLMAVANQIVVKPSELTVALAGIAVAVANAKQVAPSELALQHGVVSAVHQAIAASLITGERVAVLIGAYAEQHPDFAMLDVLSHEIASLVGAKIGYLGGKANSVGAAVVGCVPQTTGQTIGSFFNSPKSAYVLMGVEPELDLPRPAAAIAALKTAKTVIVLSAFRNQTALDYADVLLPITPFTETAGSFVNMEGSVQSFNGSVKPLGDARPAWKVLRVLGNQVGATSSGFAADSVADLRAAIAPDLTRYVAERLSRGLAYQQVTAQRTWRAQPLERLVEVPIYASDSLVRRAGSLQKSADGRRGSQLRLSAATAESLGLVDRQAIRVMIGDAQVQTTAHIEPSLIDGVVRLGYGTPALGALGADTDQLTIHAIQAIHAITPAVAEQAA